MLYSATILAILIHIASSITQDCYFIPHSRLECVEYIDIQKGKHACTALKDPVQVTGTAHVINGDKWIEIIETKGEVFLLRCYHFIYWQKGGGSRMKNDVLHLFLQCTCSCNLLRSCFLLIRKFLTRFFYSKLMLCFQTSEPPPP